MQNQEGNQCGLEGSHDTYRKSREDRHLIVYEPEAVVDKEMLHSDFFVFCGEVMGTLPYKERSTASHLTPGKRLAKEQQERPAGSATTRAPGGLPSFLLGDFPGGTLF
ncbi:hypothetical protein AV530_005425 [Patagioenas fasciata monilis]|uniref:Uncharacterized protein n=1 Tax=Patagioenas fasciata monilis TaxID=372326 RepID=A0A1V4JLJ6_PATFA|nr:hypothetical protein AV530_005425 [Patagioenas fasciata monilis]